MPVSSARRFGLLLVAAVVLVLAFAYLRVAQSSPVKPKRTMKVTSTAVPKAPSYAQDVFCTDGNHSWSHPMICVVEGLVAKPKEAYIYDVEPDSPEKRSSRHVKIHWFSQRTVDLDVTFKTAGCVENLTCDRRGHCEATVSVTLKKGEQKRCTYKTKLFGQKDPEEDIVINPCCM